MVSNRGPVSYDRDAAGSRVERRGAGGLVTALRGLRERGDVTWIASAITDEDRVVAAEGGVPGLRLVAHDERAYDLFYNAVANPVLWFTLHALWDRAREPSFGPSFHDAWRDGYERVNEGFAEAVVAELDNKPDALVWFHDYHLFLAPRLVRDLRRDAVLGHFVHTPWPVDWTALPEPMRRQLHDGLVANDIVGFHTARWAANFRRSTEDELGTCEARVTHHPISVDPAEFDRLADGADVLAAEQRLLAGRPERLVVRVDRADPSKNIVRGFQAFGLLLDEHPEWRGRVQLLARLDPSREQVPEYTAYRRELEEAAREVEGRHPGSIRLELADDFPGSLAAYRQYDVLFVNAVSDGLNLVAKEGPLVNRQHGVLVLSENAGAHEELEPWVVTVNPGDVEGQARALHEALVLDEPERRRRAEALAAHVRGHDVAAWIDVELAELAAVRA